MQFSFPSPAHNMQLVSPLAGLLVVGWCSLCGTWAAGQREISSRPGALEVSGAGATRKPVSKAQGLWELGQPRQAPRSPAGELCDFVKSKLLEKSCDTHVQTFDSKHS